MVYCITNKIYSCTMRNFQIIVLYVWQTADKIFHLRDFTYKNLATRLDFGKKLKIILSYTRHFLKQT